MDRNVMEFIEERKQEKIKKETTNKIGKKPQEELDAKMEKIEEEFDPGNWIAKMAKNASHLQAVTHPSKMSHPSSKTSPIIFFGEKDEDGLLRSGNVEGAKLDTVGNAAFAMAVKFLNIATEDGRTVYEHIKEDTSVAKELLSNSEETYESLKEKFLSMYEQDREEMETDPRIKQVFFPENKGRYHLLSIMTNSGVVYEIKKRVESIIFKKKRERGDKYKTLGDLAIVSFGGANPINVSFMSAQNGGKSYAFLSLPPSMGKRSVRLPNKDFFFTVSKKDSTVSAIVDAIVKIFVTDYNNVNIRNAKKNLYGQLIETLAMRAARVREEFEKHPYAKENTQIPSWQKIWLFKEREGERLDSDEWLSELKKAMARWIVKRIEDNEEIKKRKIKLSKSEFEDVASTIEEYRDLML